MSSQTIAALGIGNMGAALAKALLHAGNKLIIWNRTADRPLVHELVKAGASYEGNVHTAITQSQDTVILCFTDYNAIYAALDPIKGYNNALTGKTIVNLTNGTPKQAGEMEKWIKARGATHYFDGSVLVTPEMIATPHSLLIYSGENQVVFDSHVKSLVSVLGNPVYHGSQVGAAAAQDIAMLAAMYGLFQGALVGMNILKRSGGDSGDIKVLPGTENITTPIIGALAPLLNRLAHTIDDKSWADNNGNPLDMMLYGIRNIIEAADDVGVDASGFQVLANAMAKGVDDGYGNGDFAVSSNYLLK